MSLGTRATRRIWGNQQGLAFLEVPGNGGPRKFLWSGEMLDVFGGPGSKP